MAFSPDGKCILAGSEDKTAKVWDARTGQDVLFNGYPDGFRAVAFSPDSKRILTGSGELTVKVWDAEKGQELLSLQGHTVGVTSVAFGPDGKRVFAWDLQNKGLAWSTQDGKPVDPRRSARPATTGAVAKSRRLPEGHAARQ